MDHIVEGAQVTVPFIANPRYDAQGFSSFPARAGWILEANGTWLKLNSKSPKKSALEGFLQSWLFFGVLEEVLGVPIKVEDFIDQVNYGSSHITTNKLPTYLEKWKTRVNEEGPQTIGQLVQAQMVLDEAYSLVSKYCTVSRQGAKPLWNIMPSLALSFSVLGETLSYAITRILCLTKIEISGWLDHKHLGWGYSELLLQKMHKDLWCPYWIHNLLEILQRSVCGQLFAAHYRLHPNELGLDHKSCSNDVCKAREAGLYNICQLGTDRPCQCNYVAVNMERLIDILESGKTPILRYSAQDKSVGVVAYKPDLRYAIISHVFADGFANPEGNSVRSCHLLKFHQIFEKLSKVDQSLTFTDAPERIDTPMYFWIDSLAIPIGDKYMDLRRRTVKYMHNMYKNASFTIVLDMGLMLQRRGRTYADAAMRIATSFWMTRLWTLQEACLSRRLLFIFNDTILDIDDLEANFPETFTSPVPWAARSYYSALLGPERAQLKHSSVSQLLNNPNFLTSVWNALALRRTAVPHHEPLAIATLLGLNTDEFVNVEFNFNGGNSVADPLLGRKMCQLLEMVARISDNALPAGLIFFSKPKLMDRGFSWAPASWLKVLDAGHQYLNKPQQAAKLTANGLEVSLPGFILHRRSIDSLNGKIEQLVFPCDRTLETWIVLQIHSWKAPSEYHQIAVVTERIPVGQEWQRALLVEIVKTVHQTHYSRILSTADIRVERHASNISTLANTWKNDQSQLYMGELKTTNILWCIDGLAESGRNPDTVTFTTMSFRSIFANLFIYAKQR